MIQHPGIQQRLTADSRVTNRGVFIASVLTFPKTVRVENAHYCRWLRLADSGYATVWRPSVRPSVCPVTAKNSKHGKTGGGGGLSVARGYCLAAATLQQRTR